MPLSYDFHSRVRWWSVDNVVAQTVRVVERFMTPQRQLLHESPSGQPKLLEGNHRSAAVAKQVNEQQIAGRLFRSGMTEP